ncbi:MAG: hypothetical protein K8S00_02215, partial [Bacteroidales bacterium]|nr:hypothetical protein [Bacteroidales bacterium]
MEHDNLKILRNIFSFICSTKVDNTSELRESLQLMNKDPDQVSESELSGINEIIDLQDVKLNGNRETLLETVKRLYHNMLSAEQE